MDTRDTPEQAELRRVGPPARRGSSDPDRGAISTTRRARGASPARCATRAGWSCATTVATARRWRGGVEAAIVADALGGGRRRRRVLRPAARGRPRCAAPVRTPSDGVVVAFSADLVDVAVVHGPRDDGSVYAVDGATEGGDAAYVLLADGAESPPREVRWSARRGVGADLTRGCARSRRDAPCSRCPTQLGRSPPTTSPPWPRSASRSRPRTWSASCAACSTSPLRTRAEREQYGVPDRLVPGRPAPPRRGSLPRGGSLERRAARVVGGRRRSRPSDAVAAGRVAKAYCARAARTVSETAVQVHGGIGNTWECIVHVYLRRALLSSQWFGDDGVQLRCRSQRDRLGVHRWTSVTPRRRPSSGPRCERGSPTTTRAAGLVDRRRVLGGAGRLARLAVRRRLLRAELAEALRRPRAPAGLRRDPRRGARGGGRAAASQPRVPRPGDHDPWQRGDPGALPPRPDQRTRALVPGVQRARRRVRTSRRCAPARSATATST